jgi:hypothetical protein
MGDEVAGRRWQEEHYAPDGSRFLSFATDLAPADAAMLEDHARTETTLATIVESFRQGVGRLGTDLTVQGGRGRSTRPRSPVRRSCCSVIRIRTCPCRTGGTPRR